MITTATEGYVTAKIDLLGLVTAKCVSTGKTRVTGNGEVEAEFMVISPGSNQEKVWLTRNKIV